MPYLLSFVFLFIIACSSYKSEPAAGTPPETPLEEKRNCLAASDQTISDSDIDYDELSDKLAGEGLGGWVHGGVESQSMFVFTWRKPGNFFVNVNLPVTSSDSSIMEKIKKLRRHDRLVIKGKFIENNAPIRHINVSEIVEIVEWKGIGSDIDYDYKTDLPADVLSKTSLKGKVHAVANGGSVLVMEYGDRVFPVLSKNPDLTKGLYRNDKIELLYKVLDVGAETKHLLVDLEKTEPVCILEKTVVGHGEPLEVSGPLVFFPKSPQITRNIYAIRTEDTDQVKRNYVVVNFTDINLFNAITAKMNEVWEENEETAEYDRNKFINRKVIVKVKGTKNVISQKQANPQVLIDSMDDLEFEVLD